ncbi:hypothetical protein MTP99_012978 [Tenebrio molitor]|nr:hypothetical protein MTP99_012978 [Tenebrio molitor]
MADARDHENDATIGSEKKKDGRWFTGGTPRRTHAANEGSRAGGLPTTDFAPELDLQIEEKEDISRFSKLQAFLKKKSSNHRAKKANVLEITHIDKFLGEADNNEYLMMKIVLIMGIFGACRCDELVKMSVDDVTEVGTYLSIDIPMTKTDKPRRFVIVKEGCSADPIALYQKYISLRPANIKHN